MEPLIGIQPRTSSSGGKKPDEIVKDIIHDINTKFANVQLLDSTKANQKSILVNPEEDEEEKKEGENKEEKKEGENKEEKKEEEKKERR